MLLREIAIIAKLLDRLLYRSAKSGFESPFVSRKFGGKAGMSKIRTYFGFKNGKLVSVLHSINGDLKKAVDCNYYITEPQEVEKQIDKWKKENS